MVEESLTVFRVRLVLKWRVGCEAVVEASGVGRLFVSTAELKPRDCRASAVKRSVSWRGLC